MNKSFKSALALLFGITITFSTVACGGNSTDSSNSSNGDDLEGEITASGSSALKPLAESIGDLYIEKYPNVSINVQAGGSGQGLTDVSAGNVDIGNSDIYANEKLEESVAKELVDHKVCVVSFAAVAHSDVGVDNLTKEQLVDIFTGKITNWKDVGGSDLAIVIISRPDSSGTKKTFKKYGLDNQDEVTGNTLKQDSSGAVAKAVQETEGSISYLASSYTSNTDNLKGMAVLKLDGVEMNKDSVTSGKYPIWSYEHMYTKGEPNEIVKSYLDFFETEDAKTEMNNLGYIPIADMKVSREE